MLYDYMCNDCDHKYERSRPMVQRTDGGKCRKCGSENTRQIMSTPAFRTSGGGHPKGHHGKGVMR
jgi:putative FmdB family regulatory protein